MWIYYRDVTLYGLIACVLIGFASIPMATSVLDGVLRTIFIFGVFGTGLGVLSFHYFQKQQYYMYYNLGFTKRFLIVRAWLINFGIACVVSMIIALFS